MSTIGSRPRGWGIDAVVVLAAAVSAAEVLLRDVSGERTGSPLGLAVPAVLLVAAPLLARRRFPFAAPIVVWVVAAAVSFVDGELIPSTSTVSVVGVAASFLLGSLVSRRPARAGLVVSVVAAVIVCANEPAPTLGSVAATPALFAVAWLAGAVLRSRTTDAEAARARELAGEREREGATRLAVAEERTRIARELHDVVAHSVSVMVLQVGAVRHGLGAATPEAREALERVERTGRGALGEMRQLLGAMRCEGEPVGTAPQPGLDDLDALLVEVGRAGLPVRLHRDGPAVPLPRAVELSAYRIVQEGLTNTLKHAGARRADVSIRYGLGELCVEVRDDGAAVVAEQRLGHGLLGVRERVKVYGGQMSAGAEPAGGYLLTARLPLSGTRS